MNLTVAIVTFVVLLAVGIGSLIYRNRNYAKRGEAIPSQAISKGAWIVLGVVVLFFVFAVFILPLVRHS